MLIAKTPKNTRIYAIGDIHGMAEKLSNLHAQIQTDAANFNGQKILIHMGDYIDRGRQSKQVLEILSTLNTQPNWQNWRIVNILGNHEFGCLTFIKNPEKLKEWVSTWGGETMLQSYGIPVAHSASATKMRDMLLYKMPEHHLIFLQNLPIYHTEEDYAFVHAGVKKGIPLAKQNNWDMLFIREDDDVSPFTPEVSHELPYRIVYGHRPKQEPLVTPDRICIDTGAYKLGGKLTAVALEDDTTRFLQA